MKADPVANIERSQDEPLGLETRLGAHGGRVYATDRCAAIDEMAVFVEACEVVLE
jgi:hypothetical protein